MNITRHNYEEFFILYLDNELSNTDRRNVELFADAHPDLKEELEILMSSRLAPDTDIVFDNKEQLLRTSSTDLINHSNYEEWLLSYNDNELNTEEKLAVEKFLSDNPSSQNELALLQSMKMQADESIVFPDKESLYRKEEKPVVFITWRRVAIAAAVLFAVSTVSLLLINREKTGSTDIASGDNRPGKAVTNDAIKTVIENKSVEEQQLATNDDQKKTVEEAQQPANANAPADKVNKEKSSPDKITGSTSELATTNDKEVRKTNNLPTPKSNPYVNESNDAGQMIALVDNKITAPTKEALTFPKDINQQSSVTPDRLRPLDNIEAVKYQTENSSDDDQIVQNEPGRKNKLRGFFRKITRTFEKTTNIKATDDEDRLLVGGLAIRL